MKGRALIINYKNNREGSKYDVNKLKELFENEDWRHFWDVKFEADLSKAVSKTSNI